MTKLLQTISKVQRKINNSLSIAGVAITLADMKTNLAKSTIETIRDSFGRNIRVFDTVIPVATKAGEASTAGKNICSYAVYFRTLMNAPYCSHDSLYLDFGNQTQFFAFI